MAATEFPVTVPDPGADAGVKLAGEWLVQDVVQAYGEDGVVGERELLDVPPPGVGLEP